jgi:hypothetical protein
MIGREALAPFQNLERPLVHETKEGVQTDFVGVLAQLQQSDVLVGGADQHTAKLIADPAVLGDAGLLPLRKFDRVLADGRSFTIDYWLTNYAGTTPFTVTALLKE